MAGPLWILGFDGDCLTCRQLAEEVARLAGGRLEVRSLRVPEVAAWRAGAGAGCLLDSDAVAD